MALDYRTRQALAAAEPREADGYCPECGRPWHAVPPEAPLPASRFPSRGILLGIFGVYLALTFGLRAARAYQTASHDRACAIGLPQTQGPLAGAGGKGFCEPANLSPAGWAASQQGAARDARRSLLATAGGAALAAVGVAAVVRTRLQARRQARVVSVLVFLWGAAEALIALACLQGLALYVGLVAARLAPGFPFAWETLNQATDMLLATFASISQGRTFTFAELG